MQHIMNDTDCMVQQATCFKKNSGKIVRIKSKKKCQIINYEMKNYLVERKLEKEIENYFDFITD